MKIDDIIPGAFNVAGYVFASMQENQVLQIIEFVFSVITSLVIIGFKLYQWIRKAMKDGKIDEKELQELDEIVDESKERIDKK